MIRARFIRIASLVAGLLFSMLIGAPITHADPIADIRGTVARDRANSHCPDLKYNQTLQDIAFAAAAPIPAPADQIEGMKASYGGPVAVFTAAGDPQAATLTKAYRNGGGGAIGDCSMTDFGVSFIRDEAYDQNDYGPDFIGLVFGKAAAPKPANSGAGGGAPAQDTQPPVICPAGSTTDTVPFGQQCTPKPPEMKTCPPGGTQKEVQVGQPCPAQTNAVKVTFDRGFGQWTVNAANSSAIGGSCTYTANDNNGGVGHNDTFNIGPNGKASIKVPAPLPFTSYHVVTSCTGTYDGQQVEFGHDEQDVSL